MARETIQLTVVHDPEVTLEGLADRTLITGGDPLGALDSTGNGDDPVSSPSPGGLTVMVVD